jgi:hypothetical protein
MKRVLMIPQLFLLFSGCEAHRGASMDFRGSAPREATQSASVTRGGGDAPSGRAAPGRRGKTVTDVTQESRVLGVEAVVGGDAELRR